MQTKAERLRAAAAELRIKASKMQKRIRPYVPPPPPAVLMAEQLERQADELDSRADKVDQLTDMLRVALFVHFAPKDDDRPQDSHKDTNDDTERPTAPAQA